MVEAKYKADKTIVPHLLRMYFHDYFVHACECTICPIKSYEMLLWFIKVGLFLRHLSLTLR